MNEIDKKFKLLIKSVASLSEESLFERIKLNFLSLPDLYKNILKDYFERFNFWGTLNYEEGDFQEIAMKAHALYKRKGEFVWLYNKLEDYSSKFLLYAILNNWLVYDFTSLKKSIDNRFKHYFDLDIIPNSHNEVFVDVGGYIGDSTLDFINVYGENYKRIYCYEITEDILPVLKDNLKKYPKIEIKNLAVKDRQGKVYLNEQGDISSNQTSKEGLKQVACTTLDKDIKEKIDFIKMDIEGDELSALKGAKGHIINDSPKLLISVYHKNDHLWQIPKFIYKLNKNYKFYLRYYGGELYPTEVVFIAIPTQKSVKCLSLHQP